jgi:hypothetical protein
MLATCARCGQSLKNPITFNGETYGSECVTIVADINKYELNRLSTNNLDEYLIERSKRIAKLVAEHEAQQEKIQHFTNINGWLINFLEPMTNPSNRQYNPFAASMVTELSKREAKQLTEKQLIALENMWSYGYEGINEGIVRLEFIKTSGVEENTTPKDEKLFVLSYATNKELKDLAKANKVKGYSKMKREQLEESLVSFITL